MGIVLLVDGQLGARLQLLLWMNHTYIIDDGNFLLGVPQNEGPDPIQAMTWTVQCIILICAPQNEARLAAITRLHCMQV